jgi:hypothetical protein
MARNESQGQHQTTWCAEYCRWFDARAQPDHSGGSYRRQWGECCSQLGEKSPDFWVLVEFPSLVKINILIIDARRVTEKPIVEPNQRGTFRDARCAIKHTGSMIGKKDIAGSTVDASIGLTTCFVLGMLASKGKINRDALPGNRGRVSRIVARGTLLKLGGEADRALVKDGFATRKFGNAIDMFMGVVEVVITRMS